VNVLGPPAAEKAHAAGLACLAALVRVPSSNQRSAAQLSGNECANDILGGARHNDWLASPTPDHDTQTLVARP
jgi:hypothetical protein